MPRLSRFKLRTASASITFTLIAALSAAGVVTEAAYGRDPTRADTGDSAKAARPSVAGVIATLEQSSDGLLLTRVGNLLANRGTPSTLLNLTIESRGSDAITVLPGAEVGYEITGVLTDDANQGLALFALTLVFDGGDLPQANEPTGEPTPGCDNPMINFTRPWGITNPAGFGGTPINGDLVQVGGGQNTINNTPDNAPFPIGPVLTGVAQPGGCGPAVLVTGTFTAPETEDTYSLMAVDVGGNVITEDATGVPFWTVTPFGVGTVTSLSITVSATVVVEGALDIRPGSCQNMLSVRSRGLVWVALLGTDQFDVTDVDVDSLTLTRADGVGEGVSPVWKHGRRFGAVKDVATSPDDEHYDCATAEPDGFDDLVLAFSVDQLVESLSLQAEPRRTAITLTLRGTLLDGRQFEASDFVTVVGKP